MVYERKVFTLEIELGNAAMQSGDDIARALERVAGELRGHIRPEHAPAIRIRDENGNTVGAWNVAYQRREEE